MTRKVIYKTLSIFLVALIIVSIMPFTIVATDASSEVDRINQQIQDTYSAALSILKGSNPGLNSFDGLCGAYVRDQLLALNIISSNDSDVAGNGNKMYGNTQEGKTTKGYVKIKYGGNNCLYNIVNEHSDNIYNVFVSWTHQYGSNYSNSSPGAGHVVFIHAIIDGRVYFSESYNSSYGKEGTPQNCTLSDFMRRYNKSYGDAIGAVLFTKENKIEDIGDRFYACIYNPESECQLTNSNNNVNLKSATNDANQLWYFEKDSDLGYKITSFVDGTCLDAENGEYSNGTNVQTYISNSTDSQRWYFIKNGIDHYSIRTKLGNAYIDAHTSGGFIEPGANTQLYSRQDTDAQVYCVNKVNDINEFLAHDIGTDFYANIFNVVTDYLMTNTDNNVTLDSEISSGTDASQIWKFERQSDGSYVIRSASNNMCLDAEMGGVEDGTNLQIYEDNGTDAQKWVLCDTGNHSYLIKSAVGNAVVDAKTSAGEIYDGTSIQLYHPNGTAAQAYDIRVIENVSEIFAEDIGTNFKAYIINPIADYRLTNNNSNVTLDSETENQNQIWRFERQEDNSYIIRSAVDSTCIDAEMGETEDGTNVQTYEYNGTEAQRWYFYKKGNNQYTIVSVKSDVVIDAKTTAGEISDGTNIQLYHPNGTDAQIYSIQMIDDEQKILGDADCDDEVTILDVTVIQRYLVGIPVNTFDVTAADCDGDEDISIIDATWIQRYLVQMAVLYSIGEPV